MVFLSRDDALQRGNGPHERDRGPRPSRRDGLLATTIQSRNGRLSDFGAVLRLPRLRTGRAEPVGSVRIPHGRPFLRLGRLYRHADRDLRLGPHGACREPVAESRAQSRKIHTEQEWAWSLTDQAHKFGIPVFMKEDLVPIIGDENMIQEMPEEFNKVLEVRRSWQK